MAIKINNESWIRLSLHNHTTDQRNSSCSSLDPLRLVAFAAMARLDGVAITEHSYEWTDYELDKLRREALGNGYCRPDFLIFAGQEVCAKNGNGSHHALVFGCTRQIPDDMILNELCDFVHQENAIVILAHPMKDSARIENFWQYDADGVEVMHWKQDWRKVEGLLDLHKSNLARIGSDDAHEEAYIGVYCTLFPDWVKTKYDVIRAIKERRVRPHEL